MKYVVRKEEGFTSAWLSLYSPGSETIDHEPDDPVFNNDRSKALEFSLGITAELWAWSAEGYVEDVA